MVHDNKFIEVLAQVVKQLIKPSNTNIKDVEKEVVENLVKKGYDLEEISDMLQEIFKITKTEIKKDMKMRIIHPAELGNLTEEAQTYLFTVKEMINESEFEKLLNYFGSTMMRIDVDELKDILEKRDIMSNHLLN